MNPSATILLPPEVRTRDNTDPCFAEVLCRNSAIKARPTHRKLKKDLIEHITLWKQRKFATIYNIIIILIVLKIL